MTYGYSRHIVTANKKADDSLIGVALGRLCIAKNVPVTDVASRLTVSRQTVYNWFTGKHQPSSITATHITAYFKALAEQ